MDVGQNLNHVNPWCSLVCVFYFIILLFYYFIYFGSALFLLFISWRSFYSYNIFTINIEVGVLSRGAFLQQTGIRAQVCYLGGLDLFFLEILVIDL